MVALRGKDIDAFLARPDAGRPIILLYGPDAGLVRERAEALIASAVDDPNDPFSLVRLDGDELSAEPSRLVDEAMTIPMFGGRRATKRANAEHPFGYGRERYFWAFVVALVLFSVGGLFAIFEGIEQADAIELPAVPAKM